ncbi:MAG TPA: hypothetical protein VNF71_15420 [Acidimicrobiales bacterium]|nr:hypothetical protein [Acidimicrobiales bacterium]
MAPARASTAIPESGATVRAVGLLPELSGPIWWWADAIERETVRPRIHDGGSMPTIAPGPYLDRSRLARAIVRQAEAPAGSNSTVSDEDA